ncbi:MAG: MBL fold metallo-hydrolase [Planctomycetes bacterium]|nr:MBL fold metallo-hydrolase [Planctomycetota bacterium]
MLLLLLALPAAAQTDDVRFCRATNARYNVVQQPKSGYDFVPLVADDSVGLYVVYSAKQNETNTDFIGTSCIFLLPLADDEVLIFSGGFGDTGNIPGGAFFDADYDVTLIKEAVLYCMGRDLATTRIRFVAPHGHPDHITVAFVRALERAGFVMAEIAYHEGDRAWIEQLPWQAHHPQLFNVLAGSTCNQELLSYESPLGHIWFTSRPGHTPGSIDLVLDLFGNSAERVLILGSTTGGCAAPSGVGLTVAAHGTVLLSGPRRAEAEVLLGQGVNRQCFRSVKPPRLGTDWVAELDVTDHPGATSFYVFGTDAMLVPGHLTRFGEVLVNPLGRTQLSIARPVLTGTTETLTLAIPRDPTLMGLTCYAQATIFGGGIELTNGLRLVIGF